MYLFFLPGMIITQGHLVKSDHSGIIITHGH